MYFILQTLLVTIIVVVCHKYGGLLFNYSLWRQHPVQIPEEIVNKIESFFNPPISPHCFLVASMHNLNPFFPLLSDELQTPQLLGPKEEVATVSLGQDQSVVFNCAVRSTGPTQIQWLKQLHEHQQPRNKNKTVVVFDFVFEVITFISLKQ